MKFGGASLAYPKDIYMRAEIVKKYSSDNEIVIVTSAIKGITDTLLDMIENAVKGRKDRMEKMFLTIRETHIDTARLLGLHGDKLDTILLYLGELEKIIYSVYNLREVTPRAKDYILSFGERLSTWIFTETLKKAGINAQFFTGGEAGIVTDNKYGNANPDLELIDELIKIRLLPLLEEGVMPVVTGFIGVDKSGHITTLGRGGSDLSAALLAYAVEADEVWFWKDVPGILTADPRIVEKPRKISVLSYMEAAELSALGAKVLHPRAVPPLMRKRIPLRIKGYLKPEDEGTVVKEQGGKWSQVVKAVTLIKNISLINIYSTFMVGVPGISGRIFSALGKGGVNILMISQNVSEANISILISKKDLRKALNIIEKTIRDIGFTEELSYEEEVAAISVIGEGMRGTPGIASKVFTAVAEKGINVKMIAQGSSEINISFVVDKGDGEAAVRALYKRFNLGMEKT